MKLNKLIPLFLFTSIISNVFTQQQRNFWETEFLVCKDDKYYTQKNDPTVYLKVKIKGETKLVKSEVLVTGNDTTYKYKEVTEYDEKDFLKSDFPCLKTCKLKGNFKIKDNRLEFYPWKFSSEDYDELNKELSKHSYFLDIPDRTVIKVKFRAGQFGALTLPAKIYLFTKADSLVNNIQTDVNLNFMIGYK